MVGCVGLIEGRDSFMIVVGAYLYNNYSVR